MRYRTVSISIFIFTTLLMSFMVSAPAWADANSLDYIMARVKNLQDERDYDAAAQLLDRHLSRPRSESVAHEDSVMTAKLMKLQGDNFYFLGVTTRAAELYDQAMHIAKSTHALELEADVCNALYKLHLNSGNNQFSLDLLRRALDIYMSLGVKEKEYAILNNIGIYYYYQNDYQNSLDYYQQALKKAKGNKENLSKILANISEVNVAMGNLREADRNLDEALRMIGHSYDNSDALQIWINKAKIAQQLGNYAYARTLLATVTDNIQLRNPDRMIESYDEIAHAYLSMGDSIHGLRYLLLGNQLADSLRVGEREQQLRRMLVRYNSERIADNNKILELTVKQKTFSNYVTLAFTMLIVGIALYLVIRMRSDRKKNELIRSQEKELAELRELEHQRKEREITETLNQRNRELTSYSIDAASYGELMKEVIESLNSIRRNSDDKSRKVIDESVMKLKNFSGGKLNEDFKMYFNEVNPGFLDKLKESYPQLTQNDLRLCSFLYLGMSTKEIAALTFREVRSVESSRLRLRKKLSMVGEESLHEFLHKIEIS